MNMHLSKLTSSSHLDIVDSSSDAGELLVDSMHFRPYMHTGHRLPARVLVQNPLLAGRAWAQQR